MVQQCVTGELSVPFNSTPGNTMTEAVWAQMMKSVLGTGVITISGSKDWQKTTTLHQLATRAGTGMAINVDTGEAWVFGHFYQNSVVQAMTIAPNTDAAGTRADLLVLDCKWGLNSGIHLMIVQGTPGAVYPSTATPMPAAPIVQPGVEWQLPIAQINVRNPCTQILAADILDWRNFVSAGTAQTVTYVIASDNASPAVQANANAIVPAGSLKAEGVLNTAMDAVFTTFGGGTVQLSEGIYNTSGSINVPSNINLKGQGPNTLIRYQVAGGAYPVISVPTQSNVSISDLAIDCGGTFSTSTPPTPVPGADGILVGEGVNVTIKDVQIAGARNIGINLLSTSSPAASYGHHIRGCRVIGSYTAALKTTGYGAQIAINQFNGNLNGILLDGTSSTLGAIGNIITGNIIDSNAQSGVILGGAGFYVMHNKLDNNMISNNCIETDNTYYAVKILNQYTIRNTLNGNVVVNTENASKPLYGIYLDTLCINNTVMSNDCSAAAKTTAGNIKLMGSGSVTNVTPNWVRFNRSGCTAPSGASLDA